MNIGLFPVEASQLKVAIEQIIDIFDEMLKQSRIVLGKANFAIGFIDGVKAAYGDILKKYVVEIEYKPQCSDYTPRIHVI